MYKIFFYQDSRGNEPVYDYLKLLSKRKDKDSRIKLNKCNDYIQALAEYGTSIGEPYLKHQTPRREIEQAKRELVDFKQRSEGNA